MWRPIPYSSFYTPPDAPFPNGHIALRPILRVTLRNGNKAVPCYAVVDSGADHCIFPLSFALALDLNPLGRPCGTIGGVGNPSNPIYFWDIMLDLEPTLQINAYVGFTEGLEAQGVGLLGQCGFFDRVNVRFNHREKLFLIETDDHTKP